MSLLSVAGRLGTRAPVWSRSRAAAPRGARPGLAATASARAADTAHCVILPCVGDTEVMSRPAGRWPGSGNDIGSVNRAASVDPTDGSGAVGGSGIGPAATAGQAAASSSFSRRQRLGAGRE